MRAHTHTHTHTHTHIYIYIYIYKVCLKSIVNEFIFTEKNEWWKKHFNVNIRKNIALNKFKESRSSSKQQHSKVRYPTQLSNDLNCMFFVDAPLHTLKKIYSALVTCRVNWNSNPLCFVFSWITVAQLAGVGEYTDRISAEGKDSPNECPDMTLNYPMVRLQ